MIQQIFEAIAHAIIKRPKLVAGLILVLFCIGIFGTTLLVMQTGGRPMWTRHLPPGQSRKNITRISNPIRSSLSLRLAIRSVRVVLSYIDTLEKGLRQQQNIDSVQSVTDALRYSNNGNLPQNEEETKRIINSFPESVRASLYPSNVLTLVQIKLTSGLTDDGQKAVLQNVGSAVEHFNPPPGVKVELSGSPAFSQQMSEGLSSNMGVLIGGALILMIITMGILFSYVRHRFLPVLLVAIGLVTSLGLMGIAGINLNMAVIGAFPVLIGLGIDYAIQFHARFDEESRKGSIEDAVFITVTRTGCGHVCNACHLGWIHGDVCFDGPDDPFFRHCIHHRYQHLLLGIVHRHAHVCSPRDTIAPRIRP